MFDDEARVRRPASSAGASSGTTPPPHNGRVCAAGTVRALAAVLPPQLARSLAGAARSSAPTAAIAHSDDGTGSASLGILPAREDAGDFEVKADLVLARPREAVVGAAVLARSAAHPAAHLYLE